MFDSTKPTAQMLGRWQPWHDGHTALFKKILNTEGIEQVQIMVRTMPTTDNNPFNFHQVINNIRDALAAENYEYGDKYWVIQVANIVDISYGRDVGYSFTQHDLGEEVHNISATKVREQLRNQGKL